MDTTELDFWYMPGIHTVAVLRHGAWQPIEMHVYGNDSDDAFHRLRGEGERPRVTYVHPHRA